jgi:hypothetical protein
MQYFYQHTLVAENLRTNEIVPVDGTSTTNYLIKDVESYQSYRDFTIQQLQKEGYSLVSFGTLTLLYSGE